MPTNHITIPYFSANDLFKSGYKKVLRWSLLVALLLTALGVWLMPTYHPNPYVLREDFLIIEDFQILEEMELPDEKLIQAPIIAREIEPVQGDLEDEFELPNSFDIVWYPPAPDMAGTTHLDQFTPTSSKPVLLHFAKPDYPEIARISQLEGLVIIKVLVGKDGLVKQAVVLQGVHPILDRAATQAARRCRFQAGTQRTIPVKAWITIPYSFRLK